MNVQFSIIIPTCNRPEILQKVLKCLYQEIDESFEVIVVDNGEVERATFLAGGEFNTWTNLKYLQSETNSVSKAKNLGVHESEGEWCIFLDDDCFPLENYGFNLKNRLGNLPLNTYLLGKVLPMWLRPPATEILNSESALSYLSIFDPSKKAGLNIVQTGLNAAMAVRKSDIIRIGGFREDLGRQGYSILISNEETDLQSELRMSGVKPFFDPNFGVKHLMEPERVNAKWLIKRAFWQGISDAIIAEKLESTNPRRDELEYWRTVTLRENGSETLSTVLDPGNQKLNLDKKLYLARGIGFTATYTVPSIPSTENKLSSVFLLTRKTLNETLFVEFSDGHIQNASLFEELIDDTTKVVLPRRVWDWSDNGVEYLMEYLSNLPSHVKNVIFSSIDGLLVHNPSGFKPNLANPSLKYFGILHSGTEEAITALSELNLGLTKIFTHSRTGAEYLKSKEISNCENLGWFATGIAESQDPQINANYILGLFGEFRYEKKYEHLFYTLKQLANNYPESIDKVSLILFGTDREDFALSLTKKLKHLGFSVQNKVRKASGNFRIDITEKEFYSELSKVDCIVSPYDSKSTVFVSGPVMDAINRGKSVLIDPTSLMGQEVQCIYPEHIIRSSEDLIDKVRTRSSNAGFNCQHPEMNSDLRERLLRNIALKNSDSDNDE